MAGLIDLGNYSRRMARSAGETAAELSNRRDQENQMAKQADQASTLQAAGLGGSIGLMAGGPIGAAAGFLLGGAFGELI